MAGHKKGERTGKRGPVPREPAARIAKMLGKRPDDEIAKIAKVGHTLVGTWREDRGILPFGRPWKPEDREKTKATLKRLHGQAGMTLRAAAGILEISEDIAGYLSKQIKPRLVWARAGRPWGKRTIQRARAAHGMRLGKPPMTYAEIGKMLACTPQEATRLARKGKSLADAAA